MEEIKVGEYVRTREGIIDEVIIDYTGKCNNPICNKKHISCKKNYYDIEDIVKHSKNLIDLIEEGDYVNGEKVVGRGNNCILILTDEGQTFLRNIFEDNDIKSIVTKEAFKSVEYIVGGKE